MEHPPYLIGDRLPLEVVEKILVSIDSQSVFLRARSVSKTWLAALDSLVSRNYLPPRTSEERIQFAVFKFLLYYRHLLDQPKPGSEKKDLPDKKNKDKKGKKEKSKEKKSKKHKSKKASQIEGPPVQEPTPEPKATKYDINWLRRSFEIVLADLPPLVAVQKEQLILRIWFFAEEEDFIRKKLASLIIPDRIGVRIPLLGGYFLMIGAREFLKQLEDDLMDILGPYRDASLEVDPAKDGYSPDHIGVILEMSRKAVIATAKIFKLLPSKMIYMLKLLYEGCGKSAHSVLAQLFMKFITPSVFDMFNPVKQTRKKKMPSVRNNRHLNLMAIIIQSSLLGSRLREQYLDPANAFREEVKKLLVPAFEELMGVALDLKDVNKPFAMSPGDQIFMDLAIAAEMLEVRLSDDSKVITK